MIDRRTFLAASLATAVPGRGARAAGSDAADVLVVGAGLAGLEAALTLAEAGASVLVLEARARAGGRLWTLDDVPGRPEAGGNGIGSGYARLIDRANALGLGLVDVRERTEFTADSTVIGLGGELIPLPQWEGHPRNPHLPEHRARPPWAVSFAALRPYNPLPDAAAWRDPAMAVHDQPVASLLTRAGWSEAALRLAFATNPSYANSAHDMSALMWFHIFRNAELMSAAGPGAFAIAGGNQRLPEAMARALGDRVRFGTVVRRIEDEGRRITVRTADGRAFRAAHAIVALPASALRLVRIDPPLPLIQQEGVDLLPYNRVFQAHFVPRRRFWESDGLPPSMWTDTRAGRFVALRYGPDRREVTSLVAFVSGFEADALDRMAPEAATAAIMADLATLRPATRDALRPVRTVSWARDPFAGGAYACWAPGQIARFANTLPQPFGRIHFAGEHTAAVARGMEGAMESGQRAALEILTT
ncbi:flavin monoamine oxidase family protein [Thermaurantiacus sp.]